MFHKLTLDKCDIALVSESEIPMAMSGAYNKLSCEKEDAGEEGWEQVACGCERYHGSTLEPSTTRGSTTRDCRQFRNTGDIVMQVCTRYFACSYLQHDENLGIISSLGIMQVLVSWV